jgi:hypothetical protein
VVGAIAAAPTTAPTMAGSGQGAPWRCARHNAPNDAPSAACGSAATTPPASTAAAGVRAAENSRFVTAKGNEPAERTAATPAMPCFHVGPVQRCTAAMRGRARMKR